MLCLRSDLASAKHGFESYLAKLHSSPYSLSMLPEQTWWLCGGSRGFMWLPLLLWLVQSNGKKPRHPRALPQPPPWRGLNQVNPPAGHSSDHWGLMISTRWRLFSGCQPISMTLSSQISQRPPEKQKQQEIDRRLKIGIGSHGYGGLEVP